MRMRMRLSLEEEIVNRALLGDSYRVAEIVTSLEMALMRIDKRIELEISGEVEFWCSKISWSGLRRCGGLKLHGV